MDFATEQTWREVFAIAAEAKAVKRREEEIRQFYETVDRDEKHKVRVKEKEDREAKQLEEVVATTAQLAAFNQHLDAYDTGTVHALMENREALDRIRDELHRMTDAAYVLPDGRHVFKTVDGRQVIDEQGLAVTLKTIDPDAIGDNHPSWEAFKALKTGEHTLLAEQHGLIAFQAKVDEARSRASEGNMSKRDLDALDADLKASAPPSVRQKLGLPAHHEGSSQDGQAIQLQVPAWEDLARHSQMRPAPF